MGVELKYHIDQIEDAARAVMRELGETRVILVDGPMGAGKTTIIKAMCSILNTQDDVSSPTFSIVNEYMGSEGVIYHFDFYRIKDVQEAIDIGAEDYFYSGNFCFIEWASKVENILPDDIFLVSLSIEGDHTRKITLEHGE